MSDVEIEAISLTIGTKKLRLKLNEARGLYDQLSLMFGNRSSMPYVPLHNSQPCIPNPWESPIHTGSVTSDPIPTQPRVYCEKDTGENTSESYY